MSRFIKIIMFMGFMVNIQGDEIRYLTVNGEVDPRIGVEFEVIYEATNTKPAKCTQYHSGGFGSVTGSSRSRVKTIDRYDVNSSKFTIKLPIDYPDTKNNICENKLDAISVKMFRKDDIYQSGYFKSKQYTTFTLLLNKNSRGLIHHASTLTSWVKSIKKMDKTNKKYYFLGSDLDFDCITTTNNGTLKEEAFYCYPIGLEWGNGVDEIKDMNISLKIGVDESKEKFKDYQPTFFEKLF